jgi:hypothetical protein
MLIVPIVIVIVPIPIAVPAVSILVPPTMIMLVTVVASFCQFVSPVVGFLTMASVSFYGFMKMVICPDDALLAIIVGAHYRTCPEHEYPSEDQWSPGKTN